MKLNKKSLLLVIVLSFSIGVSCISTSSVTSSEGRIAFVDVDGNIQTLDLASGESNVVIDGPGIFYPCWSPDGEQIAYIRDNSEIWVYSFDTAENIRVYRDPWIIRFLHWVDSKIYFHSGGGGPSKNYVRCVDIGDDTSCRRFELWSYPGFDISRDGKLLLFQNFQNAGTYGFGLKTYDVQEERDRDTVTILPDATEAPSWSPDGTHIAFYTDEKLIKILANGRGQIILADAKPTWRKVNPPTISWSPDGSYIAYEDNGHIWIIDANGKNKAQKLIQGAEPNWGL